MENNNKKKKSLFDIILYIYFLGVIIATLLIGSIPNYKKGYHSNHRFKACYSNIRVIQGAVEMYNMDHDTMISTLNDSETQNPTLLKGYIKPVRHPETQCCYQGSGLADGKGGIWCSYHGDIDGSLGKENLYSQKKESFFDKIKIHEYLGRCIENFPYGLAWPILLPFVIYMSFFSR